MTTAEALSLNRDDDGAKEDETVVNIDNDKRENLVTGLSTICWDNAATMMDTPPPLLACLLGIAAPAE